MSAPIAGKYDGPLYKAWMEERDRLVASGLTRQQAFVKMVKERSKLRLAMIDEVNRR